MRLQDARKQPMDAPNGVLNRLRTHVRLFHQAEEGVLIIFGLIIFVLMLMIGGIAVDVMKFETVRIKLQSTSDRAALAAASLSQPMNPADVVDDYFAKASLTQYLHGVEVVNTVTSRSVKTDVGAEVPSTFMQMIGVNSLTAPADSEAKQRINDVEISLVIDISNSMNSNNRLPNLKIAAKAFVDTVLAGDAENKISISIVPFNGQVDLGPTMGAQYNLSNGHTFHSCVNFATADFASPSILPTTPLLRSDIVNVWDSGPQKRFNNVASTVPLDYCWADSRNVVRPFMRDPTLLKNAIEGLVANSNTSIDVGMKWGLALLDPGTQPVIAGMIGAGASPANFAGRPFAYDRADTAKIIVLMSDGENTDEYQVRAPYKTGLSPIWRDPVSGNLAIFHSTVSAPNQYYVIPATNFANNTTTTTMGVWQAAVPAGSINLTWPQVFTQHPMWWVAAALYGNALSTDPTTRGNIANTWWGNFYTAISPATKNAQTATACDLAKSSPLKVRVFTIAFEATGTGPATLKACASSDGDYFAVAGPKLTAAFQAIAQQVTQLRLTL